MRHIVPPIVAALIVAAIAIVSVWTQQGLLAPSLGAAVFSQMLHADEKSARPYNLAVGQLIGVVAGFVGVIVTGQAHAHALLGTHDLPAGRILAVAVAMLLAAAAQIAAGAETPTGGATALVVAMGVETPDFAGAVRLLVGIALVMTLGEAGRRLILRGRRDR